MAHSNVMTAWFVMSALWFVAFAVSFAIDRRRLRTGVYLVITLGFLGISAMMALAKVSSGIALLPVALAFGLLPLFIVALAGFLIANGVTMMRREGRRLANLLSLLAGLGIVGFLLLALTAAGTNFLLLRAALISVTGALGYISFVFVCFLLYSIFYSRIRHRRDADFVVVLGAGLIGGRVPPLLAGRLDRARAVYDTVVANGGEPMIITSGGQGPDEDRSESSAMAAYIIAAGVPEYRVLLEDKSKTTLQNLRFSREIMEARKPGYTCVVVTSNYHVLRAALLTRKAGVNGQVVGSPTARYYWPSAILREFVAILVEHRVKNAILAMTFALPGLIVLFGA